MPVALGRKASPYNFRFIQDDPLKIVRILWPTIKLSREQEEILYSIWHNDETFCAAGNMLGKDYVAGLAIVVYFLTRSPCKVVTTSATEKHMVVLWGEINRFINSSKIPLDSGRGGPLIVMKESIKKVDKSAPLGYCPNSYIMGQVAAPNSAEGMQGHHVERTGDGIPRNLFIGDEASGLHQEYYKMATTWANRMFIFGNTWDCDNQFRWAFEGRPGSDLKPGDIPRDNGVGYFRKCFRMKATDSPNVRLALAQISVGKTPTDEIIVPGLKPWSEYQKNLKLWDPIQQCVALNAEWYKGKEVRLFPQEWLDRALLIGAQLRGSPRKAKAIGVDPAEGGDKTCFCVIDEYGVIELLSEKTPDTTVITDMTISLIHKYGVPADKVFFDTGGGGKQHVDRLARLGYKVHGVAFGESVTPEPQRIKKRFDQIIDLREDKGAYLNRRAMMYGEAAILLDPMKPLGTSTQEDGGDTENKIKVKDVQAFGIPPDGPQYGELVRQLAAMPKKYVEGKLYLPPKSRRGEGSAGEKTLSELLGRSPDEADAFVLAVYAMTGKRSTFVLRGY